jgi:Kef-type K+ transport system membrane component KefB
LERLWLNYAWCSKIQNHIHRKSRGCGWYFLPYFFCIHGFENEIGLLNDPYLWKVTGFIILVAVVGRFLGSALAAKFVGQSLWQLTIGALMNTRGLEWCFEHWFELKVLTQKCLLWW